MRGTGKGSRLLRLLRWLFEEGGTDDVAHCPICRREVRVMPNSIRGPGMGLAIPRPVGELTGACATQNGTSHSAEEVAAAEAEKPWR